MPLTQGTPLSQHPAQCHPYPPNNSNPNTLPHGTVSTSASCRSQSLVAACAQAISLTPRRRRRAAAPQPAGWLVRRLKQDFLLQRCVPCASDTFPPWLNQASSMLLLPLSRPNACSVTAPKRSSSNSNKRTHHTENFWLASSSMKPSRYVHSYFDTGLVNLLLSRLLNCLPSGPCAAGGWHRAQEHFLCKGPRRVC